VVVFAVYWHRYAVNVPWFDDFEALPDFLLRFLDARSAGEKWHWLLWPNNEHRMATGKAITVALHALTGQINFRTLQALANLSTLGLLALFFAAFRRLGLPIWTFLPVPFLLFQPQYHLLSFWTITGIQHQPVLLFAFLALFLLAQHTPVTLALALGAGLVATFTMSNGMLTWPAGAVVLALQGRWRALALWVGVAAVGIGGYFYGFPSRANANSFAQFLKTPYLSVVGFFTFWGAAFDFFPNAPIRWRAVLPTGAGLGLTLFMGTWIWQRVLAGRFRSTPTGGSGEPPHINNPVRYFLLGGLLFLLANAAIVAVLRPHFGYFVLLVSNYKLYPTLGLVLAYLMFLEKQTASTTLTAAISPVSGLVGRNAAQPLTGLIAAVRVLLAGSVLFWVSSYLAYTPDVSLRRRYLLTSVYNQVNAGVGLGATRGDVGEPYIQGIFREIQRRGLYHWPDEFSAALARPTATLAALPVRIDHDDTFFTVSNDTLTPPNGREDAAYLWVRGQGERFLFPALPPPNPGRNPFRSGAGFVARFHRHLLRPDSYTLTLCVFRNGQLTAYPIQQKLSSRFTVHSSR
jgi:hypothetical protein